MVNLGGYDPSLRATIGEAVERLQAATGLPFVPTGDTTYMPTTTNPTPDASVGADIVIALSDQAHTDLVPGSIVGRTDISYTSVLVKAAVVVDMGDVGARPDVVEHRRRPGAAARARPCRRPQPRERFVTDHERRRLTQRADHVWRRRSHRSVATGRGPGMCVAL